ncbi:uncharacterized [Tachysurus ichikawai]
MLYSACGTKSTKRLHVGSYTSSGRYTWAATHPPAATGGPLHVGHYTSSGRYTWAATRGPLHILRPLHVGRYTSSGRYTWAATHPRAATHPPAATRGLLHVGRYTSSGRYTLRAPTTQQLIPKIIPPRHDRVPGTDSVLAARLANAKTHDDDAELEVGDWL